MKSDKGCISVDISPVKRTPSPVGARVRPPLRGISPGRLLTAMVLIFFAGAGGRLIQAHRRNRQQREESLRKNEERLRLVLEVINEGVWDWIVPTGEVYFSPRWQAMLGYEPGEMKARYRTWESRLHPEDRRRTVQALMDHVEGRTPGYETEYRLRTKGGTYIWIYDRGRVVQRSTKGVALRMVGTHTDITGRKQAEAQIRLLWERLERAAGDERARIARDLHDQLGQMVTVLQLELGLLKRTLQGPGQVDRCRQLIGLTTQLGDEIRSITARMRPPALDTGLVPALKYDLDRLRTHLQDLRISFHAPGLDRQHLEPETELALYTICQEALNNAIKHARAHSVDIRLQREGAEIVLAVQDDGVGFEPGGVSPGIGLMGMRERIAALGGRMEVVSGPGRGTTITAFAPWSPQELEEAL